MDHSQDDEIHVESFCVITAGIEVSIEEWTLIPLSLCFQNACFVQNTGRKTYIFYSTILDVDTSRIQDIDNNSLNL